jgi:hypothetical protein
MGAIFAVGALILANSRPYEGLVVCGVLTIALVWRLGAKAGAGPGAVRAAATATVVLVLGGAWMAYYNWRLFGNPWTLPYKTNRAAYAITPVFAWQPPTIQPIYQHAELRKFFLEWEFDHYKSAKDKNAMIIRSVLIVAFIWFYYVGPLMTVPLIFGIVALFTLKKPRLSLVVFGACVAAVSLLLFTATHYFSPATGALYVLIIFSIRATQLTLWKSRGCGVQFVRVMIVAAVISAGVRATTFNSNANLPAVLAARVRLLKKLQNTAGRHIVLVRYSADHDPHQEVVYNEADIDAAKVIWARAMDAAKDKELLDYFPKRQVWMFEPDQKPPVVSLVRAVHEIAGPPLAVGTRVELQR